MSDPDKTICATCGCLASYHGYPVCGYNFGQGRRPCECDQFVPLNLSQATQAARAERAERQVQELMKYLIDVLKPEPEPELVEVSTDPDLGWWWLDEVDSEVDSAGS